MTLIWPQRVCRQCNVCEAGRIHRNRSKRSVLPHPIRDDAQVHDGSGPSHTTSILWTLAMLFSPILPQPLTYSGSGVKHPQPVAEVIRRGVLQFEDRNLLRSVSLNLVGWSPRPGSRRGSADAVAQPRRHLGNRFAEVQIMALPDIAARKHRRLVKPPGSASSIQRVILLCDMVETPRTALLLAGR
jgi:hypothetical protein